MDVAIQAGLGRFFACKLRAGLAWAVGTTSSSAAFLREAVRQYRAAREAWSNLADKARGVYVEDVTFGFGEHLRGHWADRLGDIDADITAMEGQLAAAPAGEGAGPATDLLAEITAPPDGPGLKPRRPACLHLPPDEFERGQPLRIELAPEPGRRLAGARLHYRHANQAEQYHVEDMTPHGRRYEATVPAAYSDSPYALVYYFELHGLDGDAWLWPGLAEDLSNQPYFVVREKRSAD